MTSLKVAVRVRPLTERESILGSNVVVDVCGRDIIVTDVKVPANRDCDHRVRVHRFTFDYGFWSVDPSSNKCASQKTVYEEFGRVVLNTLLEGYNSCVIAYGPSGSGKTHTMMGTKEENGLTPRICEGLFEKLTDQADNHLPFQIDISFMEIYNEQVFDLLQRNETGNYKKPKLRVREHPIHGPFVEGLTTHIVHNIDKVCDLLARGNENRVKAATHVHDRSTRSHVIFTIRCSQACLDESKPREVISKLHLVDLAGSEKAAPEFCDERVKEGGNINKSLVTLGNVISVLVEMSQRTKNGVPAQKRAFVPYRDSNLTWLLKDSLGGNSHTFMLAAISPSKECYIETVSTLRYAQRAQFVMNKPVVNENPGTQMIRNLKTEVFRLKNLLCTAEKLNGAYVMKPLPEIVQLRTVMEESAKRVDALTKHWFEKWLKTYNIVVNKALDQSEVKAVKSSDNLFEFQNSGRNQPISNTHQLDSKLPSFCSDSAECIILNNELVGFSKKKNAESIIVGNSSGNNDCFGSKKADRHAGDDYSGAIRARIQQKIRSYSDNSLRRISTSARSPLLKFLSLSENESLPVTPYSWLAGNQKQNLKQEQENEFTNVQKPDSDTKPASSHCTVSVQVLEQPSVNLDISLNQSYNNSFVESPFDTISEICTRKPINYTNYLDTKIDDVQTKNSFQTIKDSQDAIILSIGSSTIEANDEKTKSSAITKDIVINGNVKNIQIPDLPNGIINQVARTPSNREFRFGEQVIQESKNILEYLKCIDHESNESSLDFCSPRRKDSEIMSLLSFSSFDAPFLKSIDDLSTTEETDNEYGKGQQEYKNGAKEGCFNNSATSGHPFKVLRNNESIVDVSDKAEWEHRTSSPKSKQCFSMCPSNYNCQNERISLSDAKSTDKLRILFDSRLGSCSSRKEEVWDNRANNSCLPIKPKTINGRAGRPDEYNLAEVELLGSSKPSMKLTKANLDLLEETFNEKSHENENYLNSCMTFTKQLLSSENSQVPLDLCNNENVITSLERDDKEDAHSVIETPEILKALRSPSEGRKVYDFGCWGKEYDDHVEKKMRKVEDEMKEIEIMLGKHFDMNEKEKSATVSCKTIDEVPSTQLNNIYNMTSNSEEDWKEYIKDCELSISQDFELDNSELSASIPDVVDKVYIDSLLADSDHSIIEDALSLKNLKMKHKDETGPDCESDFNDAITLDSLDNSFETEMKAWAEKYLPKYETQDGDILLDKTSESQEIDETNKEVISHDANQSDDKLINKRLLKGVRRSSSSSTCSVGSSSSDSITYVFVGKDEHETQKMSLVSKSHCSSIPSSVSLDSLERSSFQHKPSFMSPRTLSIDSLIAEDLLEQLKRGRLPSATPKQYFNYEPNCDFENMKMSVSGKTSFADPVTSCSNLIFHTKRAASVQQSGTGVTVDCSMINDDERNELTPVNYSDDSSLLCIDNLKNCSIMDKNNYTMDNDTEDYKGIPEKCHTVFSLKEDSEMRKCKRDLKELDFVNLDRDIHQEETFQAVSNEIHYQQNDYMQTTFQTTAPAMTMEANPGIESEEEEKSDKLSMIFIPPPSAFVRAGSSDGHSSRCRSRESTTRNNPVVSTATQTDDIIIESEPSIKTKSEAELNYLELTSRMAELMTETIKYLKDQKYQSCACCSCCHIHKRHGKTPVLTESDSDCMVSVAVPNDRNRKRHVRHRSAMPKVETTLLDRQSRKLERKIRTLKDSIVISENKLSRVPPMNDEEITDNSVNGSKIISCEFPDLRVDTTGFCNSRIKPLCRRSILPKNREEISSHGGSNFEHKMYQKSILPRMADQRSKALLTLTPESTESQLSSPKDHLQQLVEIRRRLVEKTMQNKIKNDERFHIVPEIIHHRRRSTSSSSEGYLSSVPSRGVFSQLSETATGSDHLEDHYKTELTIQTPTKKENGYRIRPKLLEIHRSDHSNGTANNSWQNTSADSGAFFMDSPLTERYDFPEADNLINCELHSPKDIWPRRRQSIDRKLDNYNPCSIGMDLHDTDTITTNIYDANSESSTSNRISDPHALYPLTECTTSTIDSPKINLLEEFKQHKRAELTTEIRRTRLSGYSCTLESVESGSSKLDPLVHDTRTDLVKKLSDINYKVTKEDIEQILASVQEDKTFLRKRRKFLLDRKYSPKVSLYSIPGSDDELFPWDSYKQLPEPSLFIGTSA